MMLERVQYRGPLASYLEDTDETVTLEDYEDTSVRQPFHRAQTMPIPDSTRIRPEIRRELTHRTLLTADHASSRQSRFQALFETAMSPRLTPRESARFIDRFRYIICTSQLLTESVLASEVKRPSSDGLIDFKFADGLQGQWDSRRAAKHWMGSGGCVVLVSILITWAMRRPERGLPPTARASAALAASLLASLYLYAQSRRAYSRYLHSRAATSVHSMVSHCQTFDATIFRMIGLIQEVELLSRGYKIGAVLPPVARIEVNSKQRRCLRLRMALVSALNLAYTAYARACVVLDPLASRRDYNKLSDVYNLIMNDDDDDLSVLCDEADSIAYLKVLFHKMHARRRRLLCYLLAIQADGRPGNAGTWRSVVDQLSILSGLMQNLSIQLVETLEDDSHTLDTNQMASLATATGQHCEDRQRTQARGINNLSQTLRRAQAKMYILREEFSRMLGQSPLETTAREELISHYDSLGSDLHALLAEWQEGRQAIAAQHVAGQQKLARIATREASQASEPFDLASDVDSESVLIRPNSLGFWGPRMSIYNHGQLDAAGFMPLEEALREEVYEGDTIVEPKRVTRPQQTRAERIAIMRQERELKQARSEERRLQQEARQSFQGELKDVLVQRGRRPLGLRLSVHNIRLPQESPQRTPDSVISPPFDNGERKVSTASEQSAATIDSGLGSSICNYGRQ